MDLSTRMSVMYDIKHCYAIHLTFGDKLLTSLTKLTLEVKTSICSTIKENFILLEVFGICLRCPNVTHFYNKMCFTKKHHL